MMIPSGLQSHLEIARVLADLAIYMPPTSRAENSARVTALAACDTLTDAERLELAGVVVAYAQALPFGLLDEQQSAGFAKALSWSWPDSSEEPEEQREAILSAARSLQFPSVRDRLVAHLTDAANPVPADVHDGLVRQPTAPYDPVVPDVAPPQAPGLAPIEAPEHPSPATEASPVPDDHNVVLPQRDQVDSRRVLVARSVQSIVSFALPEKLEENSQFLTDVVTGAPPVEADEWGRLALLIGVYARTLPVPSLSRVQVRRLWDATRWAIWYEYWFRERNLASRINNLVSLLQRLSPGDATEIVERTAPELRMIATIAKPRALKDIADYLDTAGLDGPEARRILIETREQLAQRAEINEVPAPSEQPGTPVPPALVPERVRELLRRRLTHAEAASVVEKVWEYLDPQFDEANRNRLRRGQQGEARPLTDVINYAVRGPSDGSGSSPPRSARRTSGRCAAWRFSPPGTAATWPQACCGWSICTVCTCFAAGRLE